MLSTATATPLERLQTVLSPAKRKGVKQHRYCERCGMHHYDAQYKHCGTCRELSRDFSYLWYWDHVKRKLCTKCNDKSHGSGRMCERHRDYYLELLARVKQEQIDQGLCTWGRCPNELINAQFCEEHTELRRQREIAWRHGIARTDLRLRQNREQLSAASGRRSLRAVPRRESRKVSASSRRAR